MFCAGWSPHRFNMNSVAPNYFETMRIPLYLGCEFTWNDTRASGSEDHPEPIVCPKAALPRPRRLGTAGNECLGENLGMRSRPRRAILKYQDLREPPEPDAYVPIMEDPQAEAIPECGG